MMEAFHHAVDALDTAWMVGSAIIARAERRQIIRSGGAVLDEFPKADARNPQSRSNLSARHKAIAHARSRKLHRQNYRFMT
ncbi:MAG: hypothetical protein R3D52_01000 [Xanthobacteraceae bacterium]